MVRLNSQIHNIGLFRGCDLAALREILFFHSICKDLSHQRYITLELQYVIMQVSA